MLYIDAIIETTDKHGCVVIDRLKYTDTLAVQAVNVCTKTQMIDYINKYPESVMTKYRKNGAWFKGENVRVVDNSYLRTDANRTLKDNLGELPRF